MNATEKILSTASESSPRTDYGTDFAEWFASKHWHPDYKDIAWAAYRQGVTQGEKQKDSEWMQRMVEAYARNGANAFGER